MKTVTVKIEPTFMDRVYAAMADNPASTTRELADKSGINQSRVAKMVAKLVATGKAQAGMKRTCRVTGRWMTPWRLVA